MAIALVATTLTLIPYALGHALSQEGLVYTSLVMNPEDAQTYWAKMLQGYDGHWLYTIPFTPEVHQGAFVGVFYVWLGQLASMLNISLLAMWHAARVVAGVILFLVTFRFVAAFLTEPRVRWTAYLLAIFGSGLGWLLFLLNQPYWLDAFPVDFKQPGAHLFFTALTFPHITIATALILLNVYLLWRLGIGDWRLADHLHFDGPWPYAVLSGVINVALGIAYPFLIYIVAITAMLFWFYLVWRARRILWRLGFLYAVMFAIPAPLYLYYAYAWQTNAVFRAWDAQAITPSAPWPHYLVAYGPMLLPGLVHWIKRPSERPHFAILWLWVLAVALLLYAPLNPQRRFVQGVHVPLSILATAGFVKVILPWLAQTRGWQALVALPRYETERLKRFVTVLFLIFMSLSNIYLLADVSRIAALEQPDPLFRPEAEVTAAAWLRRHANRSAVVLGDYQTGNYVAARAGQRVVLGHWAETVDYEAKKATVERFYDADTSDAWRQDFLRHFGVDYVWYGPRERKLGNFDPGTAIYLKPIYSNSTLIIYSVQRHMLLE